MSANSMGTRCVNRELCGEGFRDMRGLINCKGCGLKFRSGAEFGTHAKKVDERKKNRQEMAEQMMIKGRQGQGEACDNTNRGDTATQGGGKPGTVKQNSEITRTHVRMPGQAAVGMPGLATTNKAGLGSIISELSSVDKMPPDQINVTSGPGLRKTDISGHTASSMSVPRPQPTDMLGHSTVSVSTNSLTHLASSSRPQHRSACMSEYLVQEVGNKGNIEPHSISITPYSTNLPTVLPTQHPVVTQQILQQQQQLALQQEQQQQLLILRQQLHQQQHPPTIPVLQPQAAHFPDLPSQQLQQVSDRDRQIALLEKELRIQKMMLEVERREAMLREQAALLSVQAERIKQEQLQAVR